MEEGYRGEEASISPSSATLKETSLGCGVEAVALPFSCRTPGVQTRKLILSNHIYASTFRRALALSKGTLYWSHQNLFGSAGSFEKVFAAGATKRLHRRRHGRGTFDRELARQIVCGGRPSREKKLG